MAKKIMYVTAGFALLAASCGSNQEQPKEIVVTDTINTTTNQIVEVAAPIDSAAVVAYYEAAHAKVKAKNVPSKHKAHAKQKTKQVMADSHEIVEHHDVITAPVPETTAPAPVKEEAKPAEPIVIVVHDVQKVYFRPDEKASFPGGEKAFDEYLVQNLTYPEEALEKYVEGTVHAVVSLDEQGNITKVDFPDGRLGYGLNMETERLLMASPRWNPAKHAGVPVKSKFGIPITFDIK